MTYKEPDEIPPLPAPAMRGDPIREALQELVSVARGLADQQAVNDDWWFESVKRAEALLAAPVAQPRIADLREDRKSVV